jgi:2-methylcitrate dehydratase
VKDLEGITSVLVETHEAGYTILGKGREKWRPKTKETADHSLPYMVGMALLRGKVDNSTYSDRNLADPEILALLTRIRVVEDLGFTELYPAKGVANRVTIKEAGGREITAQVVVPRGHPLNPMTKAEIEAKFTHLTRRRLGERRVREALSRLWNLEKERDLGSVLGLLSVDKGSKA